MNKSFARLLPLALLAALLPAIAFAQQPNDPSIVRLGNAVVTGFSGTVAPDAAKVRAAKKPAADLTFIDPDGPSARVIDVAKPGYVWDGRVFAAPKTFNVLAKDVGQVFGIALDDAPAPNIYLAATSVFGLNIVSRGRDGQPQRRKKGGPGAGWMRGQFGLDLQGGPGAIYKIDGRTGVPTLFANVTLDGVPNPGAGLGNLAYDAAHKQLFVSDLYTGMIHRFDLDGKELDRYDHGVTGLAAAKLAPVAFNPANRPNIASDRFDSEKPDTWGFAPAARRVFGLAVHEGRLYYSVVSGPQIWSVGLTREGAFANDPRWELDVPAQAGPLPVSDIAFSNKGAMILAQRALIAGTYDYSAFTRPGEPQVFRVWLKTPNDPPSPGRWRPVPEEYAVGFAGNYRNTNGGVALGYGYGRDGAASGNACEFSLWTTAQNMRNAPPLKTRLDPGGALVVHGIQGLPASPVRDINTPPWLSYSVPYGDRADDARAAGHLGSVRIYTKPCASPALYSGPGYPARPPYIVTTTVVVTPADCIFFIGNCPPPGTPFDLGVGKIGEYNPNNPNGPYNFTIGVRNLGGAIAGPATLTVTDVVPAGMTFTNVTSANWNCLPVIGPPIPAGGTLTCTYSGSFPIAPNQSLGWITIVATGGDGPYENCANLGQTDSDPSNNKACVKVEKPKVGELIVEKVVVSHLQGTQLPSTTYPVNVTCGGTATTLNLVDGIPQTIGNIPYTTSCSVVEPTPPVPANVCPIGSTGTWTVNIAPASPITISGVTTTVTVTNTFDCKPNSPGTFTLTVKKEVINHTNPQIPTAGTVFAISTSCALGSSPAVVMPMPLLDNGSQTVSGLANGTVCTITETPPAPPTMTAISCLPGFSPVWTIMPPAPVTIANANATALVQNILDCKPDGGTPFNLGIAKIGEVNLANPNGPYNFTIGVRNLGAVITGPTTLTFTDVVPAGMTFTNVTSANWNCLPVIGPPMTAGATLTCTYTGAFPINANQALGWVTIVATGGNGPQTNCANLGQPDGDASDDKACATVEKNSGNFTVMKEVVNNTSPQVSTAGLVFPVAVTCGSNVTNLNLINGLPQTVGPIPFGTTCTVLEGTPPTPTGACPAGQLGWTPPTLYFPSNSVTVVSGVNSSIIVRNTLECKPAGGGTNSLTVRKEVINNTNPQIPIPAGTVYAISTSCVSGSSPATVTPMPLTANGSQTVNGLALSTVCTISETPPAPPPIIAVSCAAPGTVPVWTTIVPAPVTITGPTATAVVQNILDCKAPGPAGYLLVGKTIINQTRDQSSAYTAALNALVFPVTATCDGNTTPLNLSVGVQGIVHAVPVGQHCSVVEGTLPPPPTTGCIGGRVPTWVTPPTYTSTPPGIPVTMTAGAGPVIHVINTLICAPPKPPAPPPIKCTPPQVPNPSGKGCVTPPPACKAPLVQGAVPGQCVCPAGTRKVGVRCVEQLACRSPQKPNKTGTACECPNGMTKKGNTCVKKERERPRVTPNDVIRVLPGVLGPGGFGGGGRSRDGGGGGGGGGKGGKP